MHTPLYLRGLNEHPDESVIITWEWGEGGLEVNANLQVPVCVIAKTELP